MWRRLFGPKPKLSNSIVVVSGIPRSGTSMMMQMLVAGGMEAVTDHIRTADDDNPSGYYELEEVKKLKENASFLESSYGKAVKIISLLLYDLPKTKNYKIIFMKRDLEEVLASQKMMLVRNQKPADSGDHNHMKQLFEKHLDEICPWIENQKNMDVIYIDYADVIENPLKNAQMVNAFLDHALDAQKMTAAVEERLYRERAPRD